MMHAVIASKKNWLLLIINQTLNQTPFPLPDTQNKTVSRKTVSVSRKIYRFPEISRRRTRSGDHVNMGQLGRTISPINGHRQIIGNPAENHPAKKRTYPRSAGRKMWAKPKGQSGLSFAIQYRPLSYIFLPVFRVVWRKNGVSCPVQKPCT